jgi:uncharacterized lipoprotein YajG
MMRRSLPVVAAVVLLVSCAKPAPSPKATAPLTQRQHDSAIGASGLPGATGIHSAQRVADSMAARRARIDSASQPEQE